MIMKDMDDLENLFDLVSAQCSESSSSHDAAPASIPAVCAEEGSDSREVVEERPNSDNPIYERLGGIVRQLHDSLKELGYDRTLAEMAGEMSDSKERLEYIASLTEQAANKVLNAIDESMPEQEKQLESAKAISARFTDLLEGRMSVDEFKVLVGDAQGFAQFVASTTEQEKARLMDIMMAQDFQDITGQIIKKMVGITTKLEQELAQLLKDNAPHMEHKDKPVDLMAGPAVPNKAMRQDDVDDLLANLGF